MLKHCEQNAFNILFSFAEMFFLARFFKLENLACIVTHFPIKTCLFKSNLLLSLYHKKFAKSLMQISQINNNTDRTLDVFFSRFRGFSFTIILRQMPKGMPRLIARKRMRVTPFGFCLRVMNEKPLKFDVQCSICIVICDAHIFLRPGSLKIHLKHRLNFKFNIF